MQLNTKDIRHTLYNKDSVCIYYVLYYRIIVYYIIKYIYTITSRYWILKIKVSRDFCAGVYILTSLKFSFYHSVKQSTELLLLK